jgi:hypothetical protein
MDHLNFRSDATSADSTCTGDTTTTARTDAVPGDVGQSNFYGVSPGAPKPDYINLEGLRDRLLAPREVVRDKDGYLVHPDYPLCDEGTRADKFLEAFGIESSFVGMEHDASEALYAEYLNGFDVNAWTPTPPAGDGWVLLELYDTENGPYALFARRKVEAPRNRRRGAPSEAPAQRPTDDALWDQTLQERDRYHEWADKLADAIAQHVDVDIGEHSSGNNPWAAALAALESMPTADASEVQADAYVPIHPKLGPLWANTVTTLDADHPAHYAMRPVYLAFRNGDGAPPSLLAADHRGMRVDYSGLLKQAIDALKHGSKEAALAEMLSQLKDHLTELGRRWYAGDTAVVDELLQLYCVEKDARITLAAAPTSATQPAQPPQPEPVPTDDARDAARYRWAIALEDNAEALYCAVLSCGPREIKSINIEIDDAMALAAQPASGVDHE